MDKEDKIKVKGIVVTMCCMMISAMANAIPQIEIDTTATMQTAIIEETSTQDTCVLIVKKFNTENVGDSLHKKHPIVDSYENYMPYNKKHVMRKEAGDLYVNFLLNQSELLPDFRDNAAMLEKILAITQMIQDDSRCQLHKIQIIGLASIEGPNRHNEDLSDQRAIALKNYVKQHVRGLSENKFELYGGGEAWAEFRDQINDLLIDTKLQSKHPTLTRLDLQRMMDIIDNEGNLDIREQKLRRINDGETFKYLLSTLLADQRNSGYLRIYYDRVPDSRADIINYALELMTEKEFENACELLQTVKDDSRSWNALGISLYMTGQKEEGIHYITLAAEQGNADAIRNLKQLNSHKE